MGSVLSVGSATLQWGALLYAVCAYPVWLIVGIPVYQVASYLGWIRWWQLALLGVLLGGIALPILPYGILLMTGSSFDGVGTGRFGIAVLKSHTAQDWLNSFGLGLGFGAVSGLLFALIVRMPMASPQLKAP